MPTENGFSNQKKLGDAQYKTVHNLGSNRYGTSVSSKALSELSAIPKTITDVHVDNNQKDVFIEVIGHGARKHDVIRFMSGTLIGYEVDIVKVIDANTLQILNVYTPTIGDTVKLMRWVTSKADSEGNLNFSPGPTQFVKNGVTAIVTQDSVVPANNKALPSLMTVYKDGTEYPVTKDTAVPGNTVAIPVEIVSASGTTVTINAGDINVQTSHAGANYDSMRIGNGTNLLNVNADGSINAVTTTTGLTDAQLRAAPVVISGTVSTGGLTDAQIRATALPVSGPLTDAQLRASAVPVSIGGTVTTSGLTDAQLRATPVPFSAASLPLPTGAALESTQTAQNALIGAVTEAAPATDVASSGLNGRLQRIAQRLTSLIALLPASLGAKTSANSLSVTFANDQTALPAPAKVASYQELTSIALTAQTITAPAGAKWCKIQADGSNPGNLRVKIGGATATGSSGIALEAGRSEDFEVAGDISVIAESGAGNRVYVIFGV